MGNTQSWDDVRRKARARRASVGLPTASPGPSSRGLSATSVTKRASSIIDSIKKGTPDLLPGVVKRKYGDYAVDVYLHSHRKTLKLVPFSSLSFAKSVAVDDTVMVGFVEKDFSKPFIVGPGTMTAPPPPGEEQSADAAYLEWHSAYKDSRMSVGDPVTLPPVSASRTLDSTWLPDEFSGFPSGSTVYGIILYSYMKEGSRASRACVAVAHPTLPKMRVFCYDSVTGSLEWSWPASEEYTWPTVSSYHSALTYHSGWNEVVLVLPYNHELDCSQVIRLTPDTGEQYGSPYNVPQQLEYGYTLSDSALVGPVKPPQEDIPPRIPFYMRDSTARVGVEGPSFDPVARIVDIGFPPDTSWDPTDSSSPEETKWDDGGRGFSRVVYNTPGRWVYRTPYPIPVYNEKSNTVVCALSAYFYHPRVLPLCGIFFSEYEWSEELEEQVHSPLYYQKVRDGWEVLWKPFHWEPDFSAPLYKKYRTTLFILEPDGSGIRKKVEQQNSMTQFFYTFMYYPTGFISPSGAGIQQNCITDVDGYVYYTRDRLTEGTPGTDSHFYFGGYRSGVFTGHIAGYSDARLVKVFPGSGAMAWDVPAGIELSAGTESYLMARKILSSTIVAGRLILASTYDNPGDYPLTTECYLKCYRTDTGEPLWEVFAGSSNRGATFPVAISGGTGSGWVSTDTLAYSMQDGSVLGITAYPTPVAASSGMIYYVIQDDGKLFLRRWLCT